MHFYNEHNVYRAAVLRERMEEGLLPWGVVDERDIQIIPDEDFLGYTQIHLFAGIGGFPLGLRRARFAGDSIVTGGFPCQDISNAGKRAGITGTNSRLWREMVRCIRVVRPRIVFVENVAALLVRGMGDVLGDLAEIGYDAEGDCISAADVGAPHLRRRIWIVAHAECPEWRQTTEGWHEPYWNDTGREEAASGIRECREDVADAASTRCNWGAGEEQPICGRALLPARFSGCGEMGHTNTPRLSLAGKEEQSPAGIAALDGAGRWEPEPDVGRVAHGVPKRVDRLAALGDAIVPACVEEVVRRLVLGKFYT